jgi:hypothetical protein
MNYCALYESAILFLYTEFNVINLSSVLYFVLPADGQAARNIL